MSALLLLLACGTQELVVNTETRGCEDYDFEDPAAEDVQVVKSAGVVDVTHTGVEEACDALFDPDLTIDGRTIEVVELWSGGDADACTVCLAPTISIDDPPKGKYEVRWFIGDTDTPLETVNFEVD